MAVMPSRVGPPRAATGRGWLALVITMTMMLFGLGAAQPARAADGVVGDVSAQVVKGLTVEERWPNGEVRLWEGLKAVVTIDSRVASPDHDPANSVDAGDWFVISFPENLTVPSTTVELRQQGVTLANCAATTATAGEAGKVLCTFTPQAAERQFVEGTMEAWVQANKVTTESNFRLLVGSDPQVVWDVPIPGGQVLPGIVDDYPSVYRKHHWQDTANPREIIWILEIPAAQFNAGAAFTITDTTQGDGVLMQDRFRLGYWADAAAWTNGQGRWANLAAGSGNVTLGGTQVATNLEFTGSNSFTLRFNNFDPGNDGLYRIEYRTRVNDGVVSGQEFINEAITNGRNVSVTEIYDAFLSGNLNGPGFGGLAIDKQVTGPGASLALDKQFHVVATWTDAGGAVQRVDLYPQAGGASAQLNQIPTGTQVTLTEVMDPIAGVPDYQPTFSSRDANVVVSPDGTSAVVTIAEQATIAVVLSNQIAPALVSIGDRVWWDHDRDGVQDAAEPSAGGVTVALLDAAGAPVLDDAGNPRTTTTDGNGFYSFTDLVPSTGHRLAFTAPDGASWTIQDTGGDDAADSDVDPASGVASATSPASGANRADAPDDPTFDAGLVRYNLRLTKTLDTAGPYHTGQQVTYTLNPSNDGPSDALAGWSVTDLLPAGLELVSMSGDGYRCTGNVCVAEQSLTAGATGPAITVVARITATSGDQKNVAYVAPSGEDVTETVPLGPTPTLTTDTATSVTDNDDEQVLTVSQPVRVGDHVWVDADHDGIQEPGEAPIPGAVLAITTADGGAVTDVTGQPVTQATTDAEGRYFFEKLPPGQYIVKLVSLPDAYAAHVPTLAEVGSDRAIDSSTGSATSARLAGGEEDLGLDFGFWLPGPSITIDKRDNQNNPADSKNESVLLADGSAKLVFTITNAGDEALRDVQVSDEVVRGGKVTNLVCSFPDGSKGVGWAGPFAVGASFQCTADLADVKGNHQDVAKVVGIGVDSGKTVDDDNPYFAHVKRPGLPSTGGEALGMLALPALALLGVGAAAVAVRRRR